MHKCVDDFFLSIYHTINPFNLCWKKLIIICSVFFFTDYRVFTEYVTNINKHIEDMCASVRVLNVAKLFYLPLFMSTIKW